MALSSNKGFISLLGTSGSGDNTLLRSNGTKVHFLSRLSFIFNSEGPHELTI